MNNLIELPENAKRFSGYLVGHSAGIKGNNVHGTHAIAILAGAEFLFEDEVDNHGIECEIIIIPRRKLHTADTINGKRIKYGDILRRAEALSHSDAWIEKRKQIEDEDD